MVNNEYHTPVLLNESVYGLNIHPQGVYVDVTYGGGGHSEEIVKRLTTGKLVAFDRDADAIRNKNTNHQNLIVIHNSFSNITTELNRLNISAVDGLLADLGVSSHQFDVAERGFSFRFDADLDMRMDNRQQTSAAHILNMYNEEKLVSMFSLYGEIRNSKTVAAAIACARKISPFKTTGDLKNAIKHLVPSRDENKFYAQLYQALRIEVNNEMDELKELLNQSSSLIKKGGRLSVISYHSLEDRLVKNFIASGNVDGELAKDVFGNITSKKFNAINKKPIEASETEVKQNPRARSAKLRIAEKI